MHIIHIGKFLVVRESRWGPHRKPLPPVIVAKLPLDTTDVPNDELAKLPDYIREQALVQLEFERKHRAAARGIRSVTKEMQTIGQSITALSNPTVAAALSQEILDQLRNLALELVSQIEALPPRPTSSPTQF